MERIFQKTFALSSSYLGVLLVFTSAEEPMLLLWVPAMAAAMMAGGAALFVRHGLPLIGRIQLAWSNAGLPRAESSPAMWNDVWTGRVRVVPDQAAA